MSRAGPRPRTSRPRRKSGAPSPKAQPTGDVPSGEPRRPASAPERSRRDRPAPAALPSPGERQLLSTVLEVTDALISVVDREGRIISFNRASEELSGYSFEEVRGRVFFDFLLPPEEAGSVRALFARLAEGEPQLRGENHWITKTGERRRIVWANAVVRDESGAIQHLVGTGIDVTRLREADAQLRLSEAN